jgi:hypothetical protein
MPPAGQPPVTAPVLSRRLIRIVDAVADQPKKTPPEPSATIAPTFTSPVAIDLPPAGYPAAGAPAEVRCWRYSSCV